MKNLIELLTMKPDKYKALNIISSLPFKTMFI